MHHSGSHSLGILDLGISHLGLRSLKEISDGDVIIIRNSNLCYTKKRHWKALFKSESQVFRVEGNTNADICSKSLYSISLTDRTVECPRLYLLSRLIGIVDLLIQLTNLENCACQMITSKQIISNADFIIAPGY